MFVVAYTTNDRQVYHGFVYSVDFAKFFNRDKFCQQCNLKICLLWSKFVKSRQTICTCKMLAMIENLSKQTTLLPVWKGPNTDSKEKTKQNLPSRYTVPGLLEQHSTGKHSYYSTELQPRFQCQTQQYQESM